jgi:hypothetical protein
MTSLSPAALLAVEEAVRAVVDRDQRRLELFAPDAGDLYIWTRDYGRHGAVEQAAEIGGPTTKTPVGWPWDTWPT